MYHMHSTQHALRQNTLIKKHISYLVPRLCLAMIKLLPPLQEKSLTEEILYLRWGCECLASHPVRAVSINTHPRAEDTDSFNATYRPQPKLALQCQVHLLGSSGTIPSLLGSPSTCMWGWVLKSSQGDSADIPVQLPAGEQHLTARWLHRLCFIHCHGV